MRFVYVFGKHEIRPTSLMSTATKEKQAASWQQAQRSGPALYSWRKEVGLNRPTFARLVSVSERTLATYEKLPQFSAPAKAQVTEAVRLIKALSEFIPVQELAAWLQTPNPGFDGRSPKELIEAGERDLLWEMVYQTRQGTFA